MNVHAAEGILGGGEKVEKTDSVTIEWLYSPPDFFFKEVRIEGNDYRLVCDRGKCVASMEARFYDRNLSVRDELHQQLEGRFLGAQLINRILYTLSQSNITRISFDGRRHFTLAAEPGGYLLLGVNVGFKHMDAAGNVLFDSEEQKRTKISRSF